MTFEENKYWESNNKPALPKKKKVTYDDILNSLNLVVHNGVLQYINVHKDATDNELANSDKVSGTNLTHPIKSILKNKNSQKIEPQLKNSYIYNKYFKDFKDANVIEEPPKPMTREEYKQNLIKNLINRNRERKRIESIKSKKLLFTNDNNTITRNIYASKNNLNHLFRVHPSKMM
jgi:hypothetical protein